MNNKDFKNNESGVGVKQVAAALMGAVTGAGIVAGVAALKRDKGKKMMKDLEKKTNESLEKGKKVVSDIENAVAAGVDKSKVVVGQIKDAISEGKKEGKKTVREVKKSANKVAKKLK